MSDKEAKRRAYNILVFWLQSGLAQARRIGEIPDQRTEDEIRAVIAEMKLRARRRKLKRIVKA